MSDLDRVKRYANVESNLFPALREEFQANGVLEPIDLYAILVWKANRSKQDHFRRFAGMQKTFAEATAEISRDIRGAADMKERLRVLLETWGFLLPTATAVLTVLYPDDFTIYDVRVCDTLSDLKDEDFHSLKTERSFDVIWARYCRFKERAHAQAKLLAQDSTISLRDADHVLWSESWRRAASEACEVTIDGVKPRKKRSDAGQKRPRRSGEGIEDPAA